jgi:hypothetical protein
MRVAWLLAPLAGCQLVFPLDESPGDAIAVRTSFTGSSPNEQLTIAPDPALVDGDLMLAVIFGEGNDSDSIHFDDASWTQLTESEATPCNNIQFHGWVLRGVASPTTSFDFGFGVSLPHVGLVTAYTNASTAKVITLARPGTQNTTDTTISLDPAAAPAGSRAWFGGFANDVWGMSSTPTGTTLVDMVGHVAVYDRDVSGTMIPEIQVGVPINFCMVMAELHIDR